MHSGFCLCHSLQLWASLEETRGAADCLGCLLLNPGQELLAGWDVVDDTNDLTSSPNLVETLATGYCTFILGSILLQNLGHR